MAILQYKYQKRHKADFTKCLKWLKSNLKLSDYTIVIKFVELDDSYGVSRVTKTTLCAKISIDLKWCIDSDCDPLSVLIHEVLHLKLGEDEGIVWLFESLIYRLYTLENKIRQSKPRLPDCLC